MQRKFGSQDRTSAAILAIMRPPPRSHVGPGDEGISMFSLEVRVDIIVPQLEDEALQTLVIPSTLSLPLHTIATC